MYVNNWRLWNIASFCLSVCLYFCIAFYCISTLVVKKRIYTVFQKNQAPKLLAVTLSNLNRFLKFFHWQTQQEICCTALCRHSTIPNVCRYTTLWNMNDQKPMKFTVFQKNQRITTFCCQISCSVEARVLPEMRELSDFFTFQQDSAPAHRARPTVELLEN